MSKIAVIVPVLNRPQNAQPLVDSLAASEADARIMFVCSPDDPDEEAACRATGCETLVIEEDLRKGDWARKINFGYRNSSEEWLLLGADDLHFHPRWDFHALRTAFTAKASVIGTNDMGNKYVMRGMLATHALVSRAYADEYGTIDEKGKILHEGYFHNWVDLELTETAKIRKQFAFARNSYVEHMHPNWGKAEMDSTYDRGLDQKLFEEDRCLLQIRRNLWRYAGRTRNRRGRYR